MPLYVYNITGTPVTLVAGNGPAPSIPASADPPALGEAFDVTGCLRGLSGANYTALQAQAVDTLRYKWTNEPEYDTGDLVVLTGNGRPIIHWTATTPWEEIAAQILASPSSPVVMVDDGWALYADPTAFAIPAGTTFNLGLATLSNPGGNGLIKTGAGCNLSDGGALLLSLSGVTLYPTDALCPSGTEVTMYLSNGAMIFEPLVPAVIFPQVPDYGFYLEINNGGGLNGFLGLPIVTLAAGANATVYISGSGGFVSNDALGGAGIIYLHCDATSRNEFSLGGTNTLYNDGNGAGALVLMHTSEYFPGVGTDSVVGYNRTLKTIDVVSDGAWASSAFPHFTTVERDALTLGAGDGGRAIFNTTDDVGQMWDGADWFDLGGGGGEEFTQTAIKVAAYAAQPYDLVLYSVAGGGFPITLPAITATKVRIQFKHRSNSGNTLTLTPTGADTIEGGATFPYAASRGSFEVESDPVTFEWMVR